MLDSQGNYHREDRTLEYERLFRLIEKLDSTAEQARVLGYSEQFILGILASADIIRAEISGNSNSKLGSIDNPNQIPLI
jgi:hypothetical protein